MNPNQPSREQIEARLTALLLGELPEDEAVLLRWTLSQDPELSKLHDRLKIAIGLVRETVAHPAEADAGKVTLHKLSEERRRRLLEHFKTQRPKPAPQFWLKRIKVRPLVGALAALAIIAVLAAMLLPALAPAKRKAMSVTRIPGISGVEPDMAKKELRNQYFPKPQAKSAPAAAAPSPTDIPGIPVAVAGWTSSDFHQAANGAITFTPIRAAQPAVPPPAEIFLPKTDVQLAEADKELPPANTIAKSGAGSVNLQGGTFYNGIQGLQTQSPDQLAYNDNTVGQAVVSQPATVQQRLLNIVNRNSDESESTLSAGKNIEAQKPDTSGGTTLAWGSFDGTAASTETPVQSQPIAPISGLPARALQSGTIEIAKGEASREALDNFGVAPTFSSVSGSSSAVPALSPPPPAAAPAGQTYFAIRAMPTAPATATTPPNSSADGFNLNAAPLTSEDRTGQNSTQLALNENAGTPAGGAGLGAAGGAVGGRAAGRGGRGGRGGGRGGAGGGGGGFGGGGGIGGGIGGGGGGFGGGGGRGGGPGGGGGGAAGAYAASGGGGGGGGLAGSSVALMPPINPATGLPEAAPEVAAKDGVQFENEQKSAAGFEFSAGNETFVAKGGSVGSLNAQISAANSLGAFPGNSPTAIQQREAGGQVLTGGLQQTGPARANNTAGVETVYDESGKPLFDVPADMINRAGPPGMENQRIVIDAATAKQFQEDLARRGVQFGVAGPNAPGAAFVDRLEFDNSGRTAGENSRDADQLAVSKDRVPFLGDSPILGRLFQEQQKSAQTANAPVAEGRTEVNAPVNLGGANTFTGGTIVNGGTLDVNGVDTFVGGSVHQGNGNLLLADGSIQSESQGQLRADYGYTVAPTELAINAPAFDNKKELKGFYDDNYQVSVRDSGASQVQNADPNQTVTVPQNMFQDSTASRQNVQNSALQQRMHSTAQNMGTISTSSGLNRSSSTVGVNRDDSVRVTLADGNTVQAADIPSKLEFDEDSTTLATIDARKKLAIESKPADSAGLSFNFQNAPTREVLNYLADTAGVIVSQNTPVSGTVTINGNNLTRQEAVDALNAELKKNGEVAVLNGRTVTILNKLDAKTADIPVINVTAGTSTTPAGSPTLVMREFRIDPNTFYQGMQGVSSVSPFGRNGSAGGGGGGLNYLTSRDATSLNATNMQDFFNTIGVNLSTGSRSVTYNDRLGLLYVKATPGELDTIGRVVQVLNQDATNESAMVTQTFPIRFADAGQLVKKLATSASPQTTIEANAAGNSIVITDTRANIRHLSQMIDSFDVPPRPAVTNAPIPQPEFLTRQNAFSTFSMNVSDVSFKLAQASLLKGQMPDAASIRSEEFINAFNYRDPEAAAGQPLAFAYERARDPFALNRDFLRFSVKTAAAGRQAGRALNVVLLLDTSGSMERADRVAIVREALRVLAAQLQPQDTVSVVTFARTARLWADGIRGDQAGEALKKVGGITPDGGTNLEEAMNLAYQTALRHYLANGGNRVVLLTDGAANLGNVDPAVLKQKVEAERRQGIALDCFGIGWEDFNDNLLADLSGNGDGRYAFINTPEEAGTDFAAKLAGALQVAAQDVKVQVEFNPQRVTSWRQIGYATHQLTKEQFRDNSVLAAEIAAQEAGNALYTVETKPDGNGPVATVYVRYRIPGTQIVNERSWAVEYDSTPPALDQAGPAMRLAATAAEFSEWLAASPFAQQVTPDELLKDLSGVPQVYGADRRPAQLETMIREAKSISGR